MNKWDALIRTVAWLCLIVIFTYTPVLTNLLLKEHNFYFDYYEIEKGAEALFVNIGLLCMVCIDYFSVKPYFGKFFCVLLFIGVISAFIVYVHSGIMFDGRAERFVKLINNNCVSIVFHIILLCVIWFIKFESNLKEDAIIEVSEIEPVQAN